MALNGKNAVVTGAAMGIGKAISEMLLQNGAKVKKSLVCVMMWSAGSFAFLQLTHKL